MKDCYCNVKHSALFYDSQIELLDFLIPYFKTGLDNNELCVWAIPDNVSIDQAIGSLRSAIKDLDQYIEKGQFIIGDHKTFYFKNNIFTSFDALLLWGEKEKDAIRNGFNGICVLGDGSWALQQHWFNLLLYEREVENAINSHKMRAVCSYFLEKLDLKKISEIASNHRSFFINQIGNWVAKDSGSLKSEC